ncbi:MAG: hypothetical protein K9M82_10545 [Deltaproteobacteria bacterium]|nr:hypothetical protein [Deltaproteobacteria bacterium]
MIKPLRKSAVFAAFFSAAAAALAGLLLVHPIYVRSAFEERLEKHRSVTRTLGLTDPCLFTEARYTRHLSQADLHSAFQDHPLAMEHFPSGSMVLPPEHLVRPKPSGPKVKPR